MIKPIILTTSILKMFVLIAFLSFDGTVYAEDIPDIPGTVRIEMKGIHSSSSAATPSDSSFPSSFTPTPAASPFPKKPVGSMTVNHLGKIERSELSDIETKLNKAILSLSNPNLRTRDKVAGGIITALTGVCLAYVPSAEGSNWVNDFWNPCASTSMSCYELQYIDPHGGKIVDDSITAVKIDLGVAYGPYIPFRLAELVELYTPDTANVNAIKKRKGWLFKIMNAVTEVGILAGASIIGYVTASDYYHNLTSGGFSSSEILPLAIPLGVFLGVVESIYPYRSLKNKASSVYGLRQGADELRAHRLDIIQSLQKAKQSIFKMSDRELETFRGHMKKLSEKAKSDSSSDEGIEQFREILRIGRDQVLPEQGLLRRYGPKVAALVTFGTSLYVFYQIFGPKMADYWDNSAGGKSASYETKLRYFEHYAPQPANETFGLFHQWWDDCVDGIIWTSREINEATGEGTGVGGFGYNCKGIPYGDNAWTFNLPGDIDQSSEGWFSIASIWWDYIHQVYQDDAGGSSAEVAHTPAAKEFGKGAGSVFATITAILNAYGVHEVSNRLGDLFSDTPLDPQPGQKNKWFNALNLAYSTSQALVRAAPYGMLAYLALQGDTASLTTLGTVALAGKTMNFITYFQERYRAIPGATQRGWRYAKMGLSSAKESISNAACTKRVTQSSWWNSAKERLNSATEYVGNMGCTKRVTQSSWWNSAKGLLGGAKERLSSVDRVMSEGLIAERDDALRDIQTLIDLIPQIDDPYIEKMMEIRGQVLAESTAAPKDTSVMVHVMNPLVTRKAA